LSILSFPGNFLKVKPVGNLGEIGAHGFTFTSTVRIIRIGKGGSCGCGCGRRGFIRRRIGDDEFDLMRSFVLLLLIM
jgi:hypothetical protein